MRRFTGVAAVVFVIALCATPLLYGHKSSTGNTLSPSITAEPAWLLVLGACLILFAGIPRILRTRLRKPLPPAGTDASEERDDSNADDVTHAYSNPIPAIDAVSLNKPAWADRTEERDRAMGA